MLLINNYDRDGEQAKLLAEYAAQRARLNVTVSEVSESDIMTLEEIAEHGADYESWLDDAEWIRRGC